MLVLPHWDYKHTMISEDKIYDLPPVTQRRAISQIIKPKL